jgi:hypothetical protein
LFSDTVGIFPKTPSLLYNIVLNPQKPFHPWSDAGPVMKTASDPDFDFEFEDFGREPMDKNGRRPAKLPEKFE